MKIVLVRHGETEENRKGVVQGQSPGHLSELGIQQAKNVAIQLEHEKFDVMYSSDLKRCIDTAKPISEYHKPKQLILSKDLRELGYGIFEGIRIGSLAKFFLKFSVALIKVPGGKSYKQTRARLQDFLNQIYKEHPTENVLIVTHGGPIRIIRSFFDDDPKILREPVANCSVWKLEMDRPLS